MKYFVDNSKITSWSSLPAPGPGHRRSGIRMSELLMTPSLLRAAISCQHGPGAEYRRFSTKKIKRNMEICMTAAAGIWLASGKSTLTPPRLPHPTQMSSFSCLQQRVGSEVTQHSWDAECIDTMTPSVQASKRAERNNNTIPRVCVYRKGGEKATCCSSFPQQSAV